MLRHIHHFMEGIGYQRVTFKKKTPTIKANQPLHNLGYCGTKVALIGGLWGNIEIYYIRNFQNFQFWIIHSYEYLGFRGQKYQEIGVAEPTWAHGKSLKPLHSEKRHAFRYRILSPCIVCWQLKWSVYILFAVLYIFLDSHSANLRIVTPWHLLLFPFYVIDGWNPAYRYYKPFV